MNKSALQDIQQALNAIRNEIERVDDETKWAALELMLGTSASVVALAKKMAKPETKTVTRTLTVPKTKIVKKEVSYSIDWSKVDWDSLTFGNFSGIEGSNVQSWRMYCSGNCEFIGSDELIVGADDINSSLVKSFRNGSFDQQVNTSMIKNHIQQIKLACSSN